MELHNKIALILIILSILISITLISNVNIKYKKIDFEKIEKIREKYNIDDTKEKYNIETGELLDLNYFIKYEKNLEKIGILLITSVIIILIFLLKDMSEFFDIS